MSYFASIEILGYPIMCGAVEAQSADEARTQWEAKFWAAADNLRAAIPSMDDDERTLAERMLARVEVMHEKARKFGILAVARKSRARTA